MVFLEAEATQASSRSAEQISSPRISFSTEYLEEGTFLSASPSLPEKADETREKEKADFEFLSSKASSHSMLTADELFFEGKLLPYWKIQQPEQLNRISLKEEGTVEAEEKEEANKEESRVSWLLDDDPSPRPPKCTVLWKELLRLKKQRASSLSPSSSSSSTSSSSSSLGDVATKEGGREGNGRGEKHAKRTKKGLERTRSASIRIRPMINVPICTQSKSGVLPPLFPMRRGRVER